MPKQPDFHEEALHVIPYLHVSGVRESLSVLKRELAAAYERGLRDATEGWERRWAVLGPVGPYPSPVPGVCGRCGGTGVVHGPGQNGNWTDQDCDCEDELEVLCRDEDEAYEVLERWKAQQTHRVVSRLVGPWEPAPAVNAEQTEQTEHEARFDDSCDFDAWGADFGEARGASCINDDPAHRTAHHPEPSRGGTVATEPDTRAEDGAL